MLSDAQSGLRGLRWRTLICQRHRIGGTLKSCMTGSGQFMAPALARMSWRTPPAAGRGGDGKYDLSADDRDWVERTAASLGPLTDKQRDILGLLLRKRRC